MEGNPPAPQRRLRDTVPRARSTTWGSSIPHPPPPPVQAQAQAQVAVRTSTRTRKPPVRYNQSAAPPPPPKRPQRRPKLNPIVLREGKIVVQHCLKDSAFSEDLLTEVMNQGESCLCFAVCVAETSRCAMNFSNRWRGVEVAPALSAQDIANNIRGKLCTGYPTSCAYEYSIIKGLVEEKNVPFTGLQPDTDPMREQRNTFGIYKIDEWEPLEEDEQAIMNVLVQQSVAISYKSDDQVQYHTEGLVNLKKVDTKRDCVDHSVVLVGWGYFLCDDGDVIDIWIAKDSFGLEHAHDGYIYIIRNTSLAADDWMPLQPVYPIVFQEGEREIYDSKILAKDYTLEELAIEAEDLDQDVLILFYDTRLANYSSMLVAFDRASRVYMRDSLDTIAAKVNVTENWNECARYGIYEQQGVVGRPKIGMEPVINIYKYVSEGETRDLVENGEEFRLELPVDELMVIKMCMFLFKEVGGGKLE